MTAAHARGSLTLFLMTEKGFRFLDGTVSRYGELFARVVVGSDKSIDDDFESQIIELCKARGLPWMRKADFVRVESEYAMAISWRWLIDHPHRKLIVFHDSLLPRYRGFAPLVNCLINGEPEIGVSAILGAAQFDRGDILAQSRQAIAYPTRIAEAIAKVSANYLEAGIEVLEQLRLGRPLQGRPQDESEASYSLWRDDEDYELDWSDSAERLARFVDAVGSPYAGARTWVDGEPLRVLEAAALPDVRIENRTPGKVLFIEHGKPLVVCGRGLLKLMRCTTADGADALPLQRFRVRFGRR